MININNFISKYITKRTESMFVGDIKTNYEKSLLQAVDVAIVLHRN